MKLGTIAVLILCLQCEDPVWTPVRIPFWLSFLLMAWEHSRGWPLQSCGGRIRSSWLQPDQDVVES